MSGVVFQYPPELFSLMVHAVAVLCKSKKDVILFFKVAGVPAGMTEDIEEALRTNRDSVKKHETTRTILTPRRPKSENRPADVIGNVGREAIREAMHAGDVTAPRSILHGSPYPLSAFVRLIQPLRCGFVP